MTAIDEIKAGIKDDRAVIGSGRTVKLLKQGSLAKVFLSSNCSEELKKDIEHYSELSGFSVEHLDVPNEELGSICRKPFSISVVGLLKQ